jgi:hypothetical protein
VGRKWRSGFGFGGQEQAQLVNKDV